MERGGIDEPTVGLRFVSVMCTVTSYRCEIRSFSFNGGLVSLQGTCKRSP